MTAKWKGRSYYQKYVIEDKKYQSIYANVRNMCRNCCQKLQLQKSKFLNVIELSSIGIDSSL